MAIVVTCLVLGGVLLLLEKMFPKGAFGLTGLLLLAGGVGFAYYELDTDTAHILFAGTVVALIAAFGAWLRFFPRSRMGQRLVANTTVGEPARTYRAWLGKEGVANTPLRPAGKALIEGTELDVVARSGFLEKGTKVKVVEASGNRLVVDAH